MGKEYYNAKFWRLQIGATHSTPSKGLAQTFSNLSPTILLYYFCMFSLWSTNQSERRHINRRISRKDEQIVKKPSGQTAKEWCHHGDLSSAAANTELPRSNDFPQSRLHFHNPPPTRIILAQSLEQG